MYSDDSISITLLPLLIAAVTKHNHALCFMKIVDQRVGATVCIEAATARRKVILDTVRDRKDLRAHELAETTFIIFCVIFVEI